jgi:hypothetical protein
MVAAAALGAAVAVIIKDPGDRDRTAHAAVGEAADRLISKTSYGAVRTGCAA